MQIIIYKGFSIIELLIILTIMSILSTIAYPLYTHYLTRIYRQQAELTLMQAAHALEHYYANHLSYQNAQLSQLVPNTRKNLHYQFKLRLAHPQTFTLLAIPNKQQANQDECGTLSVNQLGEKKAQNQFNSACWS